MTNILAVLVAAVASMIVGMIWYNPNVFGASWMKLAGINKKKMKKKGMGMTMLVGFITTLIMAYVLSVFIEVGATTPLMTGVWLWLGFLATTQLGSVLWEGKQLQLYIINTAHSLVSIVIMAVIIGAWP
jgi:hypothetical protein